MIHLYWGEGKGKTTASMGLALRALAAGRKVTVLQFLKSTPSGEIAILEQLGAQVFRGKPVDKFVYQMNEEEKRATRLAQEQLLEAALIDMGYQRGEALCPVSKGGPVALIDLEPMGDSTGVECSGSEKGSTGEVYPGSSAQMFIIDEACGAVSADMIDGERLRQVVEDLASTCEVVMTGRYPQEWMHEIADYDTEMHCVKHPFTQGVSARRGIEF